MDFFNKLTIALIGWAALLFVAGAWHADFQSGQYTARFRLSGLALAIAGTFTWLLT